MNILMTIEEIKKYIPHRYPFLLLDRVLDVNPGKNLTALKNVTINEPFFQGHFPNAAILPGVLIVEAMAQASGLLAYLTAENPEKASQEMYYFAGIDKTKFKHPVVPGDQLKLYVEFLQEKRNFSVFKTKATAYVEDRIVCTAEILCAKKGHDHE